MRIKFLGTSHGFPEANKRCSSTLIDINGSCYLIDMGTQSIELLADLGISPESVKAVFATHMHGDHTNGLLSFIDICSWHYKNANPVFYLPGDIERSVSAIKEWLSCTGTAMRDFKFVHVDDGFSFTDENIKITAFRTKHIAQSFSYLLEADGKRVFFSGDLQIINKPSMEPDLPIEEFDKGFDIAILELAHFSAVDKYYAFLKDKTNIDTVCINHYSTHLAGTGYELRDLLPNQKMIFATDGLEFNL